MLENEFLILVDESDNPWGKLEKYLVHEKGLLHRAFSVFIFNSKGEMLLQQRAYDKYHSGGLWTNACCSHPRFGEHLTHAVERRLKEEMGLQCPVDFAFSFHYRAELENGLIENEWDHVFIGVTDEAPSPSKSEVNHWKYISVDDLRKDISKNRNCYTAWFQLILEKVIEHAKLSLFIETSK
jgi:isopentenyl-diphosphate Delta-isomerase